MEDKNKRNYKPTFKQIIEFNTQKVLGVNIIPLDMEYWEIKGYEDETIVTFLTLDEIDDIINTPMPNDRLEIAKDWLIIGCYTAGTELSTNTALILRATSMSTKPPIRASPASLSVEMP